MMTVLVREWVPEGSPDGQFAETLYEASRVDFEPRGTVHVNKHVLKLSANGNETIVPLGDYQSAFVMNSNGKTVGTYHGQPCPPAGIKVR